MSSLVLNDELIIALTIMSISGVAAWWSRNILQDINKVRVFVLFGVIASIWLFWSVLNG
ncbi:MAG: hypothetical protein VX854_02650 [Candidatus Thermoplasmatota archaeon]|nr:hypothetical protein [Candidatus Thermoplasmatota archaeon]